MLEKIAIICVDDSAEVQAFYGWLKRNRPHITAISENVGCGCCVDMFNILLDEGAEMMPCEAGGIFEKEKLLYESDRDAILDELLTFIKISD